MKTLHFFVASVAAMTLLGGCFAGKQRDEQPLTPPKTSQTPQQSPLGDIDPDAQYDPHTAGGTPQLDRPLSPIELMSPAKRHKYNELQKQKQWHRQQINQARKDRMDADMKILDILRGAGSKTVTNTSTFVDPESAIKHQRWRKKQADMIVDKFSDEIESIDRKIDKLLHESTDSCFPESTEIVMQDGSYKPIEKVVAGDRVRIYDIGKQRIAVSSVIASFKDESNHLYVLNGTIKATAYERLLTKTGWKKIRDIREGEYYFNGEDYVRVVSKSKTVKPLTVYNLSVENAHNFFVLTADNRQPFLVHNTSGGGSSSGGGSK